MIEEKYPPITEAQRKMIIREYKSARQRERRARVKARNTREDIGLIASVSCDHMDMSCPPNTCDWSNRDGRNG